MGYVANEKVWLACDVDGLAIQIGESPTGRRFQRDEVQEIINGMIDLCPRDDRGEMVLVQRTELEAICDELRDVQERADESVDSIEDILE